MGGVDPVPRVGTLGWYVPPLQGGPGSTGGRTSVDAGTGLVCGRPSVGRGYGLWAVGCGVGWSGAGPREGSLPSHAAATGCPERATHTSPGQRPGGTASPPIPRPLKGRGHRAVCDVQYVAPLQGAVGGVDPVPRVGTLGWYVSPLQGVPGSTGGRASETTSSHETWRPWGNGPRVRPMSDGLTCGLLVVVVVVSGPAAAG